MHEAPAEASTPAEPFALIRGMLRNKNRVLLGATAGILALGAWAGYRSGIVDLYPVSLVLAAGMYLALKVAIEVVELVAETLIPR